MGYIPAAIAFGVLMSAAGFPAWWAVFLSVVMYSGAGQYAAIPMLASGSSVLGMTINIGVINFRHVFYALPLLDALPDNRLARSYCLFGLTDECYSTLTSLPADEVKRCFAKLVFLNQCYWVGGTLLGVLIGSGLNQLIPHLDFALPCLFVIMAYEQYTAQKIIWPCFLAVLALVLAKVITNHYALLLAIMLCAAVILLKAWWPNKKGDNHAQ